MEQFKSLFTHYIFSYVNLYAFARALQMSETGLSHETKRDDPSGNPSLPFVGFEVGGRSVAQFGNQVAGSIGPAKFAWERLVAKRLNLFEFFLPLYKLILGLELQDGGIPFQNGYSRSIRAARAPGQGNGTVTESLRAANPGIRSRFAIWSY